MRWCLPYALCDESLQASYGTVPTYSALACQVRRHRAERYYTPRRRQFLPPGLLRPDLDVEYYPNFHLAVPETLQVQRTVMQQEPISQDLRYLQPKASTPTTMTSHV
ncbi:hypothetical protein DPSP01_009365 [Paraphaeosphaeria sporulosa]